MYRFIKDFSLMCGSARYFSISAEKCTGLPIDRLSYTQQSIDASRYDIVNKSCFSYYIAKRHELKQVKKNAMYDTLIQIFILYVYAFYHCRRLFAWLLGTEVSTSILKKKNRATTDTKEDVTYFDIYSKEMLVEAIKYLLKEVCEENSQDLKPYRILVSLLDKVDIGPIILDDILFEVFR